MIKKEKPRRILFYVHFNKDNKVSDYVIYQLQQIKPIFNKVILVSNSRVSNGDKKKFNGLYDKFIQRDNKGFDFVAWRDAMNDFGWDELAKYDELTIMNDTCFGPIFDFAPIYKKMQAKKVDFWGITNNLASKGLVADSSGRLIFAPEHIQSYYVTFNKKVISSDVFKDFWNSVRSYDDVKDVVANYEVQLTAKLAQHGFSYDSYFDIRRYWKKNVVVPKDLDISARSDNFKKYSPGYSVLRATWLLKTVDHYPFVKTKTVTIASYQIGAIRKFISQKTKYPMRLIDNYIIDRADDIFDKYDEQIRTIEGSRSFRIGRLITTPWRFLKGIIR